MFHFKRKQKEKKPEIKTGPEIMENIHVMPGRFYIEKKKKSHKIFILIVAGVALAAVIVAVFILINNYLKPVAVDKPSPITEPAAKSAVPTPPPTLPSEPPVNVNANNNTNTNESPAEMQNINSAPATEPQNPAPTPVELSGAEDEDADGLSLNEEKIYLTNSLNPDTDGDGYLDGAEIINGYDPRLGDAFLLDSNLVKIYNNQTQNYSLLKPFDWLTKPVDPQNLEVVFDSRVGEYIKIKTNLNPDNLDLVAWISQNDLFLDQSQLEAVVINSLSGYKTSDGLKYYLTSPDNSKIFVIAYDAMGLSDLSFKSTFMMMVNSFSIK